MAIQLNFENVTGGDFEPIPAGDYPLEIETVEEKLSKAGNNMLNMRFSVADGEYEGRKIFETYVLNEKSLWKLKGLLIALGEDVDGVFDLDPDDLVGQIFLGSVTVEASEGYDPQNKVKKHKVFDGVII